MRTPSPPSSPCSSRASGRSPRPALPPPERRHRPPRSRSSSARRTTSRRATAPTRTRSTREAIKYTPNVVRVYSPNATATKVKAAVAGASIVVYLGHGNGWPSPYTYDPKYTTKDGFGLNADLNGDGKLTDNENKYYGEPWIRELRPAPNAVVLLFHLCYASGNPEARRHGAVRLEGAGSASTTTPRRSCGRAPARCRDRPQPQPVLHRRAVHDPPDHRRVLAQRPGRPRPRRDLRLLAQPRATRSRWTPSSTGYYYRSIAGKMTLRTQDVTGAPYADTSVDPASIVVPRQRQPRRRRRPRVRLAAGRRWPASSPPRPCPPTTQGARRREDAARPAVGASPIYRVHTDDGSTGWMPASSLIPRDSAAPRTGRSTTGPARSRPNGDGSQDTLRISVRLSEPASWTLAHRRRRRERARPRRGDLGHRVDDLGAGRRQRRRRHLPLGPRGHGRLGQRPARGRRDASGRHAGARTLRSPTPTARPAVHPQRRRDHGHGRVRRRRQRSPGSVGATDPRRGGRDRRPRVRGGGHRHGDPAPGTAATRTAPSSPTATYTLAIRAVDRAGNRSDAAAAERATCTARSASSRRSRAVFFPQDGDKLGQHDLVLVLARDPRPRSSWTVHNADGRRGPDDR